MNSSIMTIKSFWSEMNYSHKIVGSDQKNKMKKLEKEVDNQKVGTGLKLLDDIYS